MVIYKVEWGDEIIITCPTNHLNPEECNKYHQGMLGCDPNCPYLKRTKAFEKFAKCEITTEEELHEILKPYIKRFKEV